MKLKGFSLNHFDAYADGFRHAFIVLSNAPTDGWDIVEYLVKNGFADATVLTTRPAEKIIQIHKKTLEKIPEVRIRRNVVDMVLDNVLFEWNGKFLHPIQYSQDVGKKYLFGHVIRVYRTR
jgi:hypothetical protein